MLDTAPKHIQKFIQDWDKILNQDEGAVIEVYSKVMNLRFRGENFIIDLKQGDLEDNWNSILFTDNGVEFDTNFTWEENPSLCLYPVRDGETITQEMIKLPIYVNDIKDVYFKL